MRWRRARATPPWRCSRTRTVFWQRAGLKHEAARWLGAVRGFVDDGLPPALRADFLQAETLLCVFAMVGTPSAVEGALDEALRLHRQAGDALAEYLDLYLKAQLLQRLHHGTDPAPIRVRMVALEAADWSILQRRLARWVGGLWLRDCGEAEAYRRFCLEEIGHHRDAGDQHGAWTASQGLGLAEHDRGHLGAAAAQLGATVREIRAAGHLRQYPAIVGLHACLLLEQGDLPAQLPQVLEAVQLLRVDGTLWCMAGALPLAPLARGDDQGAARVLGWADETVRRLGESPGPFFARLRAGCETRLRQSLTDAALQALRDEGALLDEAGALRLALSDA